MKDFLLMFVLVCVLGYLSLFLGNFGLLFFAAAVIAAVPLCPPVTSAQMTSSEPLSVRG